VRAVSLLPTTAEDQLGTLEPGTIVWVLTVQSPIWPARVLGYTEAAAVLPKQRLASIKALKRLRDRAVTGCAVRFFGDSSVALIADGMALPFVPAGLEAMSWVWPATELDGLGRGWPKSVYSDDAKAAWEVACVKAVAHWRRRFLGRDEDTFEYVSLAPGALVWGLCRDSPFWPGKVARREEVEQAGVEWDSTRREGGHVPVVFFGDGAGSAWMSLADLALFLPGAAWRSWMRARGEAERADRHWPAVERGEWERWGKACVEADEVFASDHDDLIFPRRGPFVGPPGSAGRGDGGGDGRGPSATSRSLVAPGSHESQPPAAAPTFPTCTPPAQPCSHWHQPPASPEDVRMRQQMVSLPAPVGGGIPPAPEFRPAGVPVPTQYPLEAPYGPPGYPPEYCRDSAGFDSEVEDYDKIF
jgi:hypothetical protein